jgi:hypothetical protein
MDDLLEVYTRPLDARRPLVGLDELPVQLVAESRQPGPARPGRKARYDYEYVRHGVANVFITCEPLRGQRQVRVTAQRTRRDWACLIQQLVDQDYPEAERIVLVLDNLNTHTPGSLYATFPPAEAKRLTDKLALHATPVHGSWLNIAELELSILTRQCLSRRIPAQATLEREVAAWQAERNARPAPVDWRFTTADASIKLKHLYPSTQT